MREHLDSAIERGLIDVDCGDHIDHNKQTISNYLSAQFRKNSQTADKGLNLSECESSMSYTTENELAQSVTEVRSAANERLKEVVFSQIDCTDDILHNNQEKEKLNYPF